ncbi:MAG TPA: hypothetical protein VGI39_34975, partial [Polyangiaceae bacterium]
ALHDLLDSVHAASPTPPDAPAFAPLFDRFAAISRVSTPLGREALIKLDAQRRLPARLGPEDLAATAYLDFPDLFAAVRVASGADGVKGFVLFEAGEGVAPCFEPARIDATTKHLGDWFDSRHRTAYCDILVRRRGPELHFEITHGKTPITHDLIDEALNTKVVTQVSTQRSYAVYYEATRVLAVHALEFIKDGIRRSFGLGCASGADSFVKSESLIDMNPLRDLDAALAPDTDLGVSAVAVRWIDVTATDGSGASYWCAKGDLRETAQSARLREALTEERARVTYVKLAIDFAGVGRTQLVEVIAPRNQLVYDRRNPGIERMLLAWLSGRGVWLGGRRESAPEAAEPAIEASA